MALPHQNKMKRHNTNDEVDAMHPALQVETRFPPCKIQCTNRRSTFTCAWAKMEPNRISSAEGANVTSYDIDQASWILPLGNPLSKPDIPVDDTFREKVRKALKPLDFLAFNVQEKSYYFSDKLTLDVQEQEIPLGFVGNFGDSVGRTAMYNLLHKVFGSSSIRAVNIGGSSKMASHRELTYEVTDVTASSESSSSETSPLKPNEEPTRKSSSESASVYEKRTFDKDFSPDVVLDYYNTELLCVKVKFQFDLRSVPQLQYLLMPVAMKQGVALGLLICTKSVLLMKCYTTTANIKMKFEYAMFKLQPGSLAADMEDVILNIYCHLRANYTNIIIN